MIDPEQALIFHTQEFTQVEIITLVRWLELALQLRGTLAKQVLAAGLEFEHYTSLLDKDPEKRTPFQNAEQQRRLTILTELLQKDDDDPQFVIPTPDNLFPNADHPIFKDLKGYDK